MRNVFVAALAFSICTCAIAEMDSATLSGKVVANTGEGFAAQVNVYQSQIIDGRRYLQQKCSVVAGASGDFTCSRLPAGTFIIREIPRPSVEKKEVISPPAAFYPGVTDLSEAESISIKSGDHSWVDLHVPDTLQVSVKGKVVPHAAEVAFTLKASADTGELDTGAYIRYDGNSGEFEARNITPGHYVLEADWLVNDYEHHAYVPFDISDRPLHNLRVSPLDNIQIAGHLAMAPQNSEVSTVYLRRVDGAVPLLSASVKDCTFSFHDVLAGKYILELSPNSHQYVKSLTVDGKHWDGSSFLATGEAEHDLEVSLAAPAAAIEGDVKEWESDATAADVVAVEEETGIVYHTVTDNQRRFAMSGLPSGTYRMFSWPGPNLVAYRVPAIRNRHLNDSEEVSLKPDNLAGEVRLTPIE